MDPHSNLRSQRDLRTDEALMYAYRNGETGAMTELVRRYENELLGFLVRLLGNRASAEDVFQETFVQIHLSVDVFDVSRRFKPWLFTIAANKGRDYYRKHGKHGLAADLSAPVRRSDGGGDGLTFVDLLEGEIPDLVDELNSEELRIQVREVLNLVPFSLREVILLAYFQKMSYQQIAESLGIPLGTVKSRLHSAVATFADQWKQIHPGSGGS